MSCSRLLCVLLLHCFRGRLRCSRHSVSDRFAGSKATKGLLRPGPCSLSLPPSLSFLSVSDRSWVFSSLLHLAARVNTLFCDCIMIYVTFSVARLVLQTESEVAPVILLNRRTGHFEHFKFPLGQPRFRTSSGRFPLPLQQPFWSLLPHAVHQQSQCG